MTRSRMPRPHEVQAARRDPRLHRARRADNAGNWRADAVCQEADPEIFFADRPGAGEAEAVEWCKGCDVQAECLATALNLGATDGVWGATTPRERRAMLVAWRMRAGVTR